MFALISDGHSAKRLLPIHLWKGNSPAVCTTTPVNRQKNFVLLKTSIVNKKRKDTKSDDVSHTNSFALNYCKNFCSITVIEARDCCQN